MISKTIKKNVMHKKRFRDSKKYTNLKLPLNYVNTEPFLSMKTLVSIN